MNRQIKTRGFMLIELLVFIALIVLTCNFALLVGKNTITYKKLRKSVWETEH
jgi:Tfp pilus assembly protein FimT